MLLVLLRINIVPMQYIIIAQWMVGESVVLLGYYSEFVHILTYCAMIN